MELFTSESINKCNQGYQSPLNQVQFCSCNIKSAQPVTASSQVNFSIS